MPLSDLPRDLRVDSSGPGAVGLGINLEDVVCLLKRHMSDSELSQVRADDGFQWSTIYPLIFES